MKIPSKVRNLAFTNSTLQKQPMTYTIQVNIRENDHPLYPGNHVKVEPLDNENDTINIDEMILSIDAFLHERGILSNGSSRYDEVKKILRAEFINYEDIESIKKLKIANIDLMQITAIINTYKELNKKNIPKDFRAAIFNDNILPKNESNPGRNYLFEYYVRSRLIASGCKAIKAEPDFICDYKGFKFGVAVKRFKINQIEKHLRKAKEQILKSKLPGLIFLDISINDIFNVETLHIGTREKYIKHVHSWMELNFFQEIRKKQGLIGLHFPIIPSVIAFHFGMTSEDEEMN